MNEIGSCAVARGFATTSLPCRDASAIYWNPAATTGVPGLSVYGGVAWIGVKGDFTQDTTGRLYQGDVPTQVVPHVFVNWASTTGRKIALGVGVYAPYGLTSEWPADFPGRFSVEKASLHTFYVQPNLAIELGPGWSVGGGPVYGHSSVELQQGIDLSGQVATSVGGAPITFGMLGVTSGTEFARATLSGNASAFGFHVGIQGSLGSNWRVGARFLSAMTFTYDNARATFQQVATGLVLPAANPLQRPAGTRIDDLVAAQFTGQGALTDQGASAKISHPWQAQFGLGYTGIPNTRVSLDVARIGWSEFKEIPITFAGGASSSSRTLIEDYKDDWSFRSGVEYEFSGNELGAILDDEELHALRGLALRMGFSYVQAAAPGVTVTPLLPDQDRRNLSMGIGIPVGPVSLDASYLHVYTPGRRGRIVERTSRDQAASQLNGGFFRLGANVASVSLRLAF